MVEMGSFSASVQAKNHEVRHNQTSNRPVPDPQERNVEFPKMGGLKIDHNTQWSFFVIRTLKNGP